MSGIWSESRLFRGIGAAGRNARHNWPFVLAFSVALLSEFSFAMFDEAVSGVVYMWAAAVAAGAVVACAVPPVTEYVRSSGRAYVLLAAIASSGTAYAKFRYTQWNAAEFLFGRSGLGTAVSLAAGACSLVVLFPAVLWLLRSVAGTVSRSGWRMGGAELAAVAACTVVLSSACMLFCSRTVLAYHETALYDMIYSFDTGACVHTGVFSRMFAGENNIHQPLFALFAFPFFGIAYFVQMLAGGSRDAFFFAGMAVQSAALMLGASFLGHAAGLSGKARACWDAVWACSFPFFVQALCLEQYATFFFYLALLAMAVARRAGGMWFPVLAAGGTMMPSSLLVLGDDRFYKGGAKAALRRSAAFALDCLVVFSACMHAPHAGNLIDGIVNRISFVGYLDTGSSGGLPGHLRQFSVMMQAVLAAPPSGVKELQAQSFIGTGWDYSADFPVWAQAPVASFSAFGVLLAALAAAGFLACRRDRWARMSAGWLLFGFLVTGIGGYGAAENGMALYSLYFGWAAVALAAGLFRKALGWLRAPSWARHVLAAAACAGLLAWNVPVYMEMLRFGASVYPA